MKHSDQANVKLARYLDEKFESVWINPGNMRSPGPNTVWFDVDPSSEGWLVIQRLQAFLGRYGRVCGLQPCTYENGSDALALGWSLTIPPLKVGLLASFIQLKEAEEAVHRVEREEFDAEEAAYKEELMVVKAKSTEPAEKPGPSRSDNAISAYEAAALPF